MRSFNLFLLLFLFFSSVLNAQLREFGLSGVNGLTSEQLVKLSKGEIVFLNSDASKSENSLSLVEAVLIFNTPPNLAWSLISKTDDQPKYIDGCLEVKV